jgi:ATP-binding cassette subfamily B protein
VRIPCACSLASAVGQIVAELFKRLTPIARIYAVALFVDNALELLSGSGSWRSLIAPVGFLVGLIFFEKIVVVVITLCRQTTEKELNLKFVAAIIKKTAILRFEDIDNSDTWDLIGRVKEKPVIRIQDGFDGVLSVWGIVIQLIGFLVIIVANVWWLGIIVLVIALPTTIMGVYSGKKHYAAQQKVSKLKRQAEYWGEVLTSRDSVDERSLYGFSEYLVNKWRTLFEQTAHYERKVVGGAILKMKSVSILMSFVTFATAAALISSVRQGDVSAGLFIALIQASISIVSLMSWDISDNVKACAVFSEYMKDLTLFVDIREIEDATSAPIASSIFESLELRNVSFRYAHSDKYALRNINLTMFAGRHYAIVGTNGSGKTTLINLLTRLYDPCEGEILINGKLITQYPLPIVKGLFAVLFQDAVHYGISVRDNIAIGDVNCMHTKQQDQAIDALLRNFELKPFTDLLPQGIHTPLGRLSEDSCEISEGQWQRITMARLMLSSSEVRILDEPTASLDPLSESRLYEKFHEISENKTTVFISHRLGSTKIADSIFVLDQGRILQRGTHDELLSQQGLYRQMYSEQRKWYE